MSKRVRKLSDLPDWFDLNKYQRATDLTCNEWWEQLFVRHEILSHNAEDQITSIVRDDPIIRMAESNVMLAYFGLPDPYPSVELTSVRTIYSIEEDLIGDRRSYARKYFAQLGNRGRSTKLQYEYKNWMDAPVDWQRSLQPPSPVIHVSVNTQVEDQVLVKQFLLLLKAIRTRHKGIYPELPKNRRPDFDGWIKFGVLPYIDLKTWALKNSVSISNRVMADAIFPLGEGGEEVVRKTTAQIVDDILNDHYILHLGAMAYSEETERTSCEILPEKN